MKAVTKNPLPKVMANNTFEVVFDVFNGPNNDQLDVENKVIVVNSKEEANRAILDFLTERAAVKQEANSIPVGYEIIL